MRFVATTPVKLGGDGGPYVEVRGIRLDRTPRHDYAHADAIRGGCIVSPCLFDIGAPAGSTYQFRSFLIDPATHEILARSAPLRRTWPPLRVRDVQFLVNGVSKPLSEFFGTTDTYLPVAAGTLRVEARWRPDAGLLGYTVAISTTGPKAKQYARCRRGTSCPVPQAVPILANQEMPDPHVPREGQAAWSHAYRVCLVGRA